MAKRPVMSMRTGAIVIRGVTLFLAGAKSKSGASKKNTSTAGKLGENNARRRRQKNLNHNTMSEKDIAYKLSMKVLETAKRETLFTRSEIDALYKIFRKMIEAKANNIRKKSKIENGGTGVTGAASVTPIADNSNSSTSVIGKSAKQQDGIDRTVFTEILHNTFDIVAENMLMDRIFCVWDRTNSGSITLEAWLHGLNLFLKAPTTKQIEFCFAVYDLNADGFITKDEMFQLLKNCLIKHPQEEDPDESVKDLVDIILRKMDKDKDGKVNLDDFRGTILEEPLLLETFGKCLPSERSKQTFLSTLIA